jgi:hypothetical protein
MPKMPKIHLDDHRDAEFIRNICRLAASSPLALAAVLIELGAEFTLRFVIEQKIARALEELDPPPRRGRRRRPRQRGDRITTEAKKKRAAAKPWHPVPIKLSERRPGR